MFNHSSFPSHIRLSPITLKNWTYIYKLHILAFPPNATPHLPIIFLEPNFNFLNSLIVMANSTSSCIYYTTSHVNWNPRMNMTLSIITTQCVTSAIHNPCTQHLQDLYNLFPALKFEWNHVRHVATKKLFYLQPILLSTKETWARLATNIFHLILSLPPFFLIHPSLGYTHKQTLLNGRW